jgi:hypothetical protein
MTEDDTLTQHEAARLLGVTPRRFRQLVQGKWIHRVAKGRYDANEIVMYKRIKERSLSMTQVALMAQRAEMSSRQTERIVKQLLSSFDIGIGLISLEKEDIEALHIRVEDELCMVYPMTTDEVVHWTRTFNSIGEEYFEAVALHLGAEEPWVPYWKLAVKMCREAPRAQCRTDYLLGLAYECLNKARDRIDRVGFLYAKDRYGTDTALRAFKSARTDLYENIVDIAIYHTDERKRQKLSPD